MRRPYLAALVIAAAASAAAFTASAARAAGELKVRAQVRDRSMSRVAFFGEKGLAGEYLIQYGKPVWKAEYDAQFDEMTKGKRLRLGNDWWTTLETFSPLAFAEGPEVAEGSWFLALECSKEGAWNLVVLDPAPLRKAHVDAFATPSTTGGTLVPLTYEKVAEEQPTLSIQFVVDPQVSAEQTLEIRFGKHRLSTKVRAKLGG